MSPEEYASKNVCKKLFILCFVKELQALKVTSSLKLRKNIFEKYYVYKLFALKCYRAQLC
jgi:hypothetical protein